MVGFLVVFSVLGATRTLYRQSVSRGVDVMCFMNQEVLQRVVGWPGKGPGRGVWVSFLGPPGVLRGLNQSPLWRSWRRAR